MKIRATKVYKTMTVYRACEIAEGFGGGENSTETEQIAAWQFIADTDVWRQLQGFYGRMVHDLIEQGIISKRK